VTTPLTHDTPSPAWANVPSWVAGVPFIPDLPDGTPLVWFYNQHVRGIYIGGHVTALTCGEANLTRGGNFRAQPMQESPTDDRWRIDLRTDLGFAVAAGVLGPNNRSLRTIINGDPDAWLANRCLFGVISSQDCEILACALRDSLRAL
jgi:hypothetical protein